MAANDWRLVVGLLLGLAGAPAACSKCEGSLAEVGKDCPAMFDGTVEGFPACPSFPVTQQGWRCGDLLVLSTLGYAGVSCYYDSSSHLLVGAYQYSDIPELCGDSYKKTAGRTTSCSTAADMIQRSCPGGTN